MSTDRTLGLLAGGVFLALAVFHLPLGWGLHYATLGWVENPRLFLPASILAPSILGAVLVHEKLVRGGLYGLLRRHLAPGLGAPVLAGLSALLPAAIRVMALPQPRVPLPVILGQAYIVEAFLALGLSWLALGTGSTVPGGLALGAVWLIRSFVQLGFHGGVLPILEVLAAMAAAYSVTRVLSRALAPHQEALTDLS